MITKDGKTHYVLSPHGRSTLAADSRAFAALMRHLRDVDPQHTVIMVQVENETGSYQSPRDFSPEANRLFAAAIPAELARRVGKSGTWTQAFGWKADQAFNAWHVARYVDQVAAAGQAELNLPMYANAALSDPFKEEGAQYGASGGPNWNVIDIWKVAAPHLSLLAPDIYDRDHQGLRETARPLRPARQRLVRSGERQRARIFALPVARARQGRDRLGAVRHGRHRLFQFPARGEASSTRRPSKPSRPSIACSHRSRATGRG